jgi:CheY-like chemotaxis protein
MAPLVLIVEDDEAIREAMSELLADEGYRVRVAADGAHAARVLDEVQPDVMLLDLMMPIMSGWELLEHMRRRGTLSSFPVVVVSAVADRTPAGVSCMLHKPVPAKTLLETLRRYVDDK